jgi:hypothetical protein
MLDHRPRQAFGQGGVFVFRKIGDHEDYAFESLVSAERDMIVRESLRPERQAAERRRRSRFQRPVVADSHKQRDRPAAARIDQVRELAVAELADMRRPQQQPSGAFRRHLIQPHAGRVVFPDRIRHFSRPGGPGGMDGAASVTARGIGHETDTQFQSFDLFWRQPPLRLRVIGSLAPQNVQTQRGAQQKRHRGRHQKPRLKKTGEPAALAFPIARLRRAGLRPYSRPQTLHRLVAHLLLRADAAQRRAQTPARRHLAPASAAALRMAEQRMIGLDRQLPTEIGVEQLFEILAIHSSHRATEPQRKRETDIVEKVSFLFFLCVSVSLCPSLLS